ncbi:MAG: RNA polymerase sigma factor [Candidatus Neoclostridium sp.]
MDGVAYEKTEYALGLIADGNDVGVDLLYRYMGKTMLFVAKGVVCDRCLAEDVVQESFLKIVKNINGYKKGTNACAWVCRIVRNTALNVLKKEKNARGRDIDEFANVSDGQDLEERSTTQILAEKIMNSLAPPIVKQMVYMKYFLDMTVREIATAIGKSKSYVSKEIIRAEEYMRKIAGDSWTK